MMKRRLYRNIEEFSRYSGEGTYESEVDDRTTKTDEAAVLDEEVEEEVDVDIEGVPCNEAADEPTPLVNACLAYQNSVEFLDTVCTNDILQMTTIADACLSGEDIQRLMIAFDKPQLKRMLKAVDESWTVRTRYFCQECLNQCEWKTCCGKNSFTWNAPILKDILHRKWRNWKEDAERIRRMVHCGEIPDSPAGHGRLKAAMLQDEYPGLYFLFSTDGVQVSGTSEKVWPIVLSPLNIFRRQRLLKENLIVVGILSCDVDPTPSILDRMFSLIELELKTFSNESGHKAVIHAICCDKPAQAKMYNFAHFSSQYSCPYCLCEDTRVMIRKGDARKDSVYGNYGLKGRSSANRSVPIYDVSIDSFHHLSEGIHKEIIEGLLSQKAGIWSLARGHRNAQKLMQFKLPRRWKGWTSDVKINQGTIYTNVFLFGASRLASCLPFGHPEVPVMIIGLSFAYLVLSSPEFCEDESAKRLTQEILDWIANHYHRLSGRFTTKWHEIAYHATYQVSRQGPLVDHSTTLMESCLCYLSSNLSKHHTRNKPSRMMSRWMNRGELYSVIAKRAASGDEKAIRFLKISSTTPVSDSHNSVKIESLPFAMKTALLDLFSCSSMNLTFKSSYVWLVSPLFAGEYENSYFSYRLNGTLKFGLFLGIVDCNIVFHPFVYDDSIMALHPSPLTSAMKAYPVLQPCRLQNDIYSLAPLSSVNGQCMFTPFIDNCECGLVFNLKVAMQHE